MPYDGDSESYVYYYDKGVDRSREEDLLYLAEVYLEGHALLTPEESRVTYREGVAFDGYYTDEMYDPQLREAFLAEVNSLIPRLEEMNKNEYRFALQKLLALLHDAHAYLTVPHEERFNIAVVEDSGGYYAIFLPQEHEDLLYSELIAINRIPLTEVFEILRPYVPYETEDYFLHYLTDPYYYNMLFCADFLRAAGVMKKREDTAQFTFRTEDGEETIDIEVQDYYGSSFQKTVGAIYYDSPLFQNLDQNYWHEEMEGTLYFRISSFHQETEQTLLQAGNELLAAANEIGEVEKLIVDIRQNGGGYRMLGYHELINVLKRIGAETVYVLMDTGSFSQAVIFATIVKQDLENAVLVGTPAGQPPNFFGAIEEYCTPNTDTTFVLATHWMSMWEGYEYDALMSDILVKQTLQDYKDGVDAVLEYVLGQ